MILKELEQRQLEVRNDSPEDLKPSSLIASSNQDNLNRRPMNHFKPAIPQMTVNEVKLKKYKKNFSNYHKPKGLSNNFTFSKQKNPEPKYVKSFFVSPKRPKTPNEMQPRFRSPKEQITRIRPLYETPKKSNGKEGRIITPQPSTKSKINPLAFISQQINQTPNEQVVVLPKQRQISRRSSYRKPSLVSNPRSTRREPSVVSNPRSTRRAPSVISNPRSTRRDPSLSPKHISRKGSVTPGSARSRRNSNLQRVSYQSVKSKKYGNNGPISVPSAKNIHPFPKSQNIHPLPKSQNIHPFPKSQNNHNHPLPISQNIHPLPKSQNIISATRGKPGAGVVITATPIEASKHVYFRNSNSQTPGRFVNNQGQIINRKIPEHIMPTELENPRNIIIKEPQISFAPGNRQNNPKHIREKSIELKHANTQTSLIKHEENKPAYHSVQKHKTSPTPPIMTKQVRRRPPTPRGEKASDSHLPIKLYPRDPTKKVLYKESTKKNNLNTPLERSSYQLETPDYSAYYYKEPPESCRTTSNATTNHTSNMGPKDKEVNFSDYAQYWEIADRLNYKEYIDEDSDLPEGFQLMYKDSGIEDSELYKSPYYTPSPETTYFSDKSRPVQAHSAFDYSGRVTPVRYGRQKAESEVSYHNPEQIVHKRPSSGFKKPPKIVKRKEARLPPSAVSYFTSNKDSHISFGSGKSNHTRYYVSRYQGRRDHSALRKYNDDYDFDDSDKYYNSIPNRKSRIVYTSPEKENNKGKVLNGGVVRRKVQSMSKDSPRGLPVKRRGNNTSKKDLLRKKISQKSISFRASESPEESPELRHKWRRIGDGARGFKEYKVPLQKFKKGNGRRRDVEKEVYVIPSNVYSRQLNTNYG